MQVCAHEGALLPKTHHNVPYHRNSNGPAVCELLAAGARASELDSRMLLWLAEFAPHALPAALMAGAEVVKKDATGNAALVTARCAISLFCARLEPRHHNTGPKTYGCTA